MPRIHSIALLAIAALIGVASDAAPAALPRGDDPQAFTYHDLLRATASYNRRTMSQAYETVGKRDPKWDAAALEFLDGMGLYFTFGPTNAIYRPERLPAWDEIVRHGKAAIDAGCDDPLVRYCHAVTLDDVGRPDQAMAVMPQIAEELFASKYHPMRALAAAVRWGKTLNLETQKVELRRADDWIMKSAIRMASGEFPEYDRRVIYSHVSDSFRTLERQKMFYDEIRKLPKADPWMVNMVGGAYHVDAAWARRGGGWARDVAEEGWRGFFNELSKARTCFKAAHEIEPNYPEPATGMITVAMGAGRQLGEDTRTWFDRAIAAQLDYWPALNAYRWSIYPRWGGSHWAMYNLGVECLQTGRYDTTLPYFFIETIESIEADGNDRVWEMPGLYENATVCLTSYGKQKFDGASWYDSLLVGIAWNLGKTEDAKAIIDRLGDRMDGQPLFRYTAFPRRLVSLIHAMHGPHAKRLEEAQAHEDDDKPDEAAKVYREIAAALKEDDPAAYYVRNRVSDLELEKQFDAGDWVKLVPPKDLNGWYAYGDDWSVEGDAIVGKANPRDTQLVCGADFGGRYEVRCRVEYVKGEQYAAYGGAVIASDGPTSRYGALVRLNHPKMILRSGEDYRQSFPAASGESNEIHVTVWDRHLTALVNGKPGAVNYQLWTNPEQIGTHVGVAAYHGGAGSIVRIKDLQIRRLTKPPAGLPRGQVPADGEDGEDGDAA